MIVFAKLGAVAVGAAAVALVGAGTSGALPLVPYLPPTQAPEPVPISTERQQTQTATSYTDSYYVNVGPATVSDNYSATWTGDGSDVTHSETLCASVCVPVPVL